MNIRTRQARGERGLVVPPPVVKQRRQRSPEDRWKQGATRLGIPFEVYVAHVRAGERWCSRHRRWQPLSEFGRGRNSADGLARSCLEAGAAAAREWQRQHRPPKRQEVST